MTVSQLTLFCYVSLVTAPKAAPAERPKMVAVTETPAAAAPVEVKSAYAEIGSVFYAYDVLKSGELVWLFCRYVPVCLFQCVVYLI